jgi:FKBP-type peptidyl-prolyl cis-trans isomerase FkpA
MNRHRTKPNFSYQSLEARQLLAGDVTVSLKGDLLEIVGDAAGNEISIVQTREAGRRVVPTAGTTINGVTTPFPIDPSVKHIAVRMNDGNDSVSISGLVLQGDLIIDGSRGNDRLNVRDVQVGFLSVFGGDGDDVLAFHNVHSLRNAQIRGQAGNDTIAITALASNRNLLIDAGEGANTVAINNLGIRKSLTIQSGTGDDLLIMTGEVYAHKTNISLGSGNDAIGVVPQTSSQTTTARFARSLNVNAGSGDDQVFLGPGSQARRKAMFQGGNGSDSLGISSAVLGRSKVRGFENRALPNLNTALDAFYARLNAAGVDTALFGRQTENTNPQLTVSDMTLQLTRSDSATAIDDLLTLTGEDVTVTGATVRVVEYVANDDFLAFTNTSAITGQFNDTTGVLTLSGSATLAQYQAALRSVTYDNRSATFTGFKSIQFQVTSTEDETQDTRSVQILTDQEAIDRFAAANGLTLQRTASGLNYLIETTGNGTFPAAGSSVRVNYRGTLLNGTQFDANENALFPLSGVIPGFRESLLLLSETGRGQFFLPSSIAYGTAGTTNIPPNAVLRFEIELLAVV